jgi:hypothetical protein
MLGLFINSLVTRGICFLCNCLVSSDDFHDLKNGILIIDLLPRSEQLLLLWLRAANNPHRETVSCQVNIKKINTVPPGLA